MSKRITAKGRHREKIKIKISEPERLTITYKIKFTSSKLRASNGK